MKIEIIVDENANDLDIVVTCKRLTPDVEKILASLRMINHQLTVKKDGEILFLDIAQIIYIESIDRKCFIYTRKDELEGQLEEYGFLRVSKSFLIHLQDIQSLRADINRRIRITMAGGEQIIASRQYAEELKKRLGVM